MLMKALWTTGAACLLLLAGSGPALAGPHLHAAAAAIAATPPGGPMTMRGQRRAQRMAQPGSDANIRAAQRAARQAGRDKRRYGPGRAAGVRRGVY